MNKITITKIILNHFDNNKGIIIHNDNNILNCKYNNLKITTKNKKKNINNKIENIKIDKKTLKEEKKINKQNVNKNRVDKIYNEIKNKYEIIEYDNGHYKETGCDAYILKNPMWNVYEDDIEIISSN